MNLVKVGNVISNGMNIMLSLIIRTREGKERHYWKAFWSY
jgi:hypothetical protein